MQPEIALTIVRSLSRGRDPGTGEPLPSSAILGLEHRNALALAAEALERELVTLDKQKKLPARNATPWTLEEIAQMVDAHTAGKPIHDIAADLERTASCVRLRLMKLGKISPGSRQ